MILTFSLQMLLPAPPLFSTWIALPDNKLGLGELAKFLYVGRETALSLAADAVGISR
jgi:hypothetical protein